MAFVAKHFSCFCASCHSQVFGSSVASESAFMVNFEACRLSAFLTHVIGFLQGFYSFFYASACGPFVDCLWLFVYLGISCSCVLDGFGFWWEQPEVDCLALYPYSEGFPCSPFR